MDTLFTLDQDVITISFQGDHMIVAVSHGFERSMALRFAASLRRVAGVKTAQIDYQTATDTHFAVTFSSASIERIRGEVRKQAEDSLKFYAAVPAQASMF